MVTISCAFRYSVSGRSTGTLISTAGAGLVGPGDAFGQPRIVRIGHDQGDGGFFDLHHVAQVSMTLPLADIKHLEIERNTATTVIASAAKQSILRLGKAMDCFVASLLAMTARSWFGEDDESDWPRGMERRRQDHAADAGDPAFARRGPARFRDQARPSRLRCRRARQGFLGAPPVRRHRGAGVLRPSAGP